MNELIARLRRCTGFDWDGGNSGKNLHGHGVTDSEAEEVFFHRPLVASADLGHSVHEERIHVLGRTDAGKALFLVCTLRGDLIRIISARPMSRREREVYEVHEKEP